MARPDKEAVIARLADRFRTSDAVLLTEYRGLSVADLKALRRAGLEDLAEDFTGPSALAFVTGEPVEAAKALRDFARDNANLVLKGGMMDGNVLDAAGVEKLASLESREVLLAKAVGAVQASLAKAAYLFAAPATQAVRTVDALRDKQEAAA